MAHRNSLGGSPVMAGGMFPPLDGPRMEDSEDGMPDFNSVHAVNATSATFHANIAAEHAGRLAQWVQYLQFTLTGLQSKVTELENWKKGALEDVRKLREEHKALRRKIVGEEKPEEPFVLPPKSKSMPILPSVQVEEAYPTKLARRSLDNLLQEDTPLGGLRSMSQFSLVSEMSASDLDAGQLEGICVVQREVDEVECTCAEWRIGNLSTKLRGCMGRALVSSPFTAAGLEDLRLMICPDGKEAAKGPRSRRQKELYAKMVVEGPLEGCLKLKAPTSTDTTQEIQYFLKVGNKRMGPFKHNFAESTVSGCDDFGVDWLKQLDCDMSLTVCIEIMPQAQQQP